VPAQRPESTAPRAASAASSFDLSQRDLTLDLARVFCVLLVVAIHLLFVGVGRDAAGGLVVSRPVEQQWWFAGVTWLGQIMPLFFVVGGFAGLTAWRSALRRGDTAADFVRVRVLRLAAPTLPLFVFYVVVIGGATLLALAPDLVATVVEGAGSPLWFIAAYCVCQSLVPTMARLHLRAPRLTVAVLLVGVVAVDAARFASGVTQIGYLNLPFVWLLVQQVGFWYADGWFARRATWQLAVVALAGYGALVPLTLVGPYSVNLLDDLNPPTLPLVVLGIAQACVLRLLRPALQRLMTTRGAQAVVLLAGSRLITIYVWHLPVIIVLAGLALLVPGASPEPASAAWWWSRIPAYLVVLGALFALSMLVGRWEQLRDPGPTPPATVVAVAAVLTFVPPFLVIEYFLDLPLAITGALSFAVAILLLGRWPAAGPRAAAR
jgi:fucose 4-O-acetylase-like acetyltransferase